MNDNDGVNNRCYEKARYLTDIKKESARFKNNLLKMATEKIAPLQDAVDLGEATDDEKARLPAWKKYRVQVSRVDTVNPVWPEQPV
ncbi:tail fiber assembly protein [Salmonella enterica]|nr:tail fiber assembly protein [Salmonella enterica]EJC0346124.1 tail fiber assembly protein [Salmonella enterica]EJC0669408.1 tail fiber assembly protein [Salmonella enterica]